MFENGIIYNLVSSIITFFKKANAVEWLKNLVKYFTKKKENVRRNLQVTIDLFIIVKFFIIIFIFFSKVDGLFWELLIWYLILTNVFTYFYYHVWIPPFTNSIESKRRRFINLFISLLFSTLCFGVLYSEFYYSDFVLDTGHHKESASFIYSFYNSLFVSYSHMRPLSSLGYIISFFQLSLTFTFLTVILAVSVPQNNDISES
jgi:hypothetical protein